MALSTVSKNDLGEFMPANVMLTGKKSDHVYKTVKWAILSRHFKPETQLLETNLARQFACSQGTIREALLRLDDDGLVRRSGYRGTRVTETSLAEAVEMVRMRLTIERAVARVLAVNGVERDRPALEALIADMQKARENADLFRRSELDRTFHAKLVGAADMELLSPILKRCSLHIHRYTLGGLEVPRDFFQDSGVGDEHRQLLIDLGSGDAARAEKAMTGHLARVLSRWAPSLLKAVGADAFAATN